MKELELELDPFKVYTLEEFGRKQLLSSFSRYLINSKVNQTFLFKDIMLPHTTVIRSKRELLNCIEKFEYLGITRAVTKEDKGSGGRFINFWNDLQMIYNVCKDSSFPFVMQPFIRNFEDIRVIIVGDYIEMYKRSSIGLRQNISVNGKATEIDKNTEYFEYLKDFSLKVLERSKFPFIHIDLLTTHNHITDDYNIYLSEISIQGGCKGSKIGNVELQKKKKEILKYKKKFLTLNEQ